MLEHVIVPLDGSLRAEVALAQAGRLAGAVHGNVVIVSVTAPADLFERQAYIRRVARRLAGPTAIDVYDSGSPSERIALVASHNAPALVCMAAHGRRHVTQAVLGSVTTAVIASRVAPVMVFGPRVHEPEANLQTILIPLDGAAAESGIPDAVALAGHLGADTRTLMLSHARHGGHEARAIVERAAELEAPVIALHSSANVITDVIRLAECPVVVFP